MAAKKKAAKKVIEKKVLAKKAANKKSVIKKTAEIKAAPRKSVAKKKAIKKVTAKKPTAKKASVKKTSKKVIEKKKAKKPSAQERQHPDLLNNRFSVAVVATMSSGKSTLLNAMLGFPLLPTKNEACTAKKVRITDVDGMKTIRCRAKQTDGIWTEWHDFRPQLMEDWNSGDCLEIEAEGDFPHIDNRPTGMQISFFDTPGPNYSCNASHAEITRSILDSSEYSFLVCVLDATSSGITDERSLLELIKLSVESKRHHVSIVFAINKVDRINLRKEPLSCLILEKKQALREIGFKAPVVFPVMAQLSLDHRLVLNNLTGVDENFDEENFSFCLNKQKKHASDYRAALLHTKKYERYFDEAVKQPRLYQQTESAELGKKKVPVTELIEADILTGVPVLEEFLEHQLGNASKTRALAKSKSGKQHEPKSKKDDQAKMRKTKQIAVARILKKSPRRRVN